MAVRTSNQVTRLLLEWSGGDQAALDHLMPVVYDELHRVAAAYLRREPAGHTLQPTALVHEAYLRLVDESRVDWHSRAHFFGAAARFIPGVCGVLVSSSSACTTRTPCCFQSVWDSSFDILLFSQRGLTTRSPLLDQNP